MVGFRSFSAQDRDELIADPRAFMASIGCEVGSSCYNQSIAGQPDLLTFAFDETGTPSYRLDTRNGTDAVMVRLPFFQLRKAQGNEVSFSAYLVTYAVGATPQTVLGTAARLAFTANMNGCTFGIGNQANANGALTVTHSNSAGHDSTDANSQAQRLQAQALVGQGGTLLEPGTYRTDAKQAVTFGYRSPGQLWRFAYLSYRRSEGRIITLGVMDVGVQRLMV